VEITRKTYIDQAKQYLNCFWKTEGDKEAENVWVYTHKFIDLDAKKKAGNELDEFLSHKFLESNGETLTVIKLRERLREIDLDANGKMALIEFLVFKYGHTVQEVINAPQGDNSKELNEAAAKLQAVSDAVAELQKQLETQAIALENQKKAEEALKKSEAELKAAIEDLNSQESAYKNAVATLEKKSSDPSGTTVSKSKAAAELAQLKSENPLPLRKAKITQEAALRKVEKERKAAEAAVVATHQAKTNTEKTLKETEAKFAEAQKYLEEVKARGGVPYGSMWWMEREMKEMQKYLPQKKQQK